MTTMYCAVKHRDDFQVIAVFDSYDVAVEYMLLYIKKLKKCEPSMAPYEWIDQDGAKQWMHGDYYISETNLKTAQDLEQLERKCKKIEETLQSIENLKKYVDDLSKNAAK